MPSKWLRMLGTTLAFVGWLGAITNCALPKWKVVPSAHNNTSPTTWEGIWMSCVERSTGQMQCTAYDFSLDATTELQVARALTLISISVGIIALFLAVAGWTYANCVDEEAPSKATVGVIAGVAFIVAGIFCLIPVCWSAYGIIWDMDTPLVVGAQRKELGVALYIGWGASALMLIGGGLLCCNPILKDEQSYRVEQYHYRTEIFIPATFELVVPETVKLSVPEMAEL